MAILGDDHQEIPIGTGLFDFYYHAVSGGPKNFNRKRFAVGDKCWKHIGFSIDGQWQTREENRVYVGHRTQSDGRVLQNIIDDKGEKVVKYEFAKSHAFGDDPNSIIRTNPHRIFSHGYVKETATFVSAEFFASVAKQKFKYQYVVFVGGDARRNRMAARATFNEPAIMLCDIDRTQEKQLIPLVPGPSGGPSGNPSGSAPNPLPAAPTCPPGNACAATWVCGSCGKHNSTDPEVGRCVECDDIRENGSEYWKQVVDESGDQKKDESPEQKKDESPEQKEDESPEKEGESQVGEKKEDEPPVGEKKEDESPEEMKEDESPEKDGESQVGEDETPVGNKEDESPEEKQEKTPEEKKEEKMDDADAAEKRGELPKEDGSPVSEEEEEQPRKKARLLNEQVIYGSNRTLIVRVSEEVDSKSSASKPDIPEINVAIGERKGQEEPGQTPIEPGRQEDDEILRENADPSLEDSDVSQSPNRVPISLFPTGAFGAAVIHWSQVFGANDSQDGVANRPDGDA